jgi:hypothetical protein
MMPDPVCPDDEEADEIADNFGQQFEQHRPDFMLRHLDRDLRHLDFNDEQRDGDGKHSIAEKDDAL